MADLSLRVSAPLCSFRRGTAREYLETDRVPPPSTVYGFLLSLIGEWDRKRYSGTRISIVLLGKPAVSKLLRTAWRYKKIQLGAGLGCNRTPDYQEILSGLDFGVWVGPGELAEKVVLALSQRGAGIKRQGALCLGESRNLVDQVQLNPIWEMEAGEWITPDKAGKISLPIWVDHVGGKGTKSLSFSLVPGPLVCPKSDSPFWIPISP